MGKARNNSGKRKVRAAVGGKHKAGKRLAPKKGRNATTGRADPEGIPPHASMETYLIHGRAHSDAWDYNHHIVPPMSASVTYRLDSVERGACGFTDFASIAAHKHEPIFIYDRLDEPTRAMLEDRLAHAEGGGFCAAFSTGMAAISAALGILLRSGDHILAHNIVYGCTFSLFTLWYPRLGITVEFCDLRDMKKAASLIRPNTRAIYTESPVNPTLDLVDIGALRAMADAANAARKEGERPLRVVVDNTFATPYGQRPLALGADIVCHALTKNIGGFGTDMGGAVICPPELEGELLVWRKDFGAPLASRAAWSILVYGLPTLPLRTMRQSESALKVARWLETHPLVSRVNYPGLESFPQKALARKQMITPEGKFMPGIMIYFETKERRKGGNELCARLMDHIAGNSYAITLAVSLGQLRTLIESPGAMTHSSLPPETQTGGGIAPNGVRLSLGIEDPDNIIRDLDVAFRAVAKGR